jgi:hypothetical protein
MRTVLALIVGLIAGIKFHILVVERAIKNHDKYGVQWEEEAKWNRK